MRLLNLNHFEPIFGDLDGRRVGVVDGIGNTGDQLLYASTRQLLRAFNVPYQTVNVLADDVRRGDFDYLLLFAGGNMGYERCTAIRKEAIKTGIPCIQLPQSWILFETGPYHKVFARERASLERCPQAVLAPDLALGFDFPEPLGPAVCERGVFIRRFGHALFAGYPGSSDPVDFCHTPEEYYRCAERYAHVVTDRLHFAITALGMQRRVTLLPVGYPKNRSLWETWLRELGVEWADAPQEVLR